MSVSLDEVVNARAEFINQVHALKATAVESQYVGREMILIGMGVQRIGQMLEAYQQDRMKSLNGTPTDEKLQNLSSFEAYVKETWGGGTILDESSFPTNEGIFGLPFNAYEALKEIDKNWRDRLPRILKRLKAHPVMKGLPSITLTVEGGGGKFKFTIRFQV